MEPCGALINGWLKSSGTPPERHLDVFIVTDETYQLGDEVPVKIIGCFVRNDGDHKLIAVPVDRQLQEWCDLSVEEKTFFQNLYPLTDEGEGWVFCRSGDKEGWVPRQIIKWDEDEEEGTVLETYDANEFDLTIGEMYVAERTLNGWIFGYKLEGDDQWGWVPLNHVK